MHQLPVAGKDAATVDCRRKAAGDLGEILHLGTMGGACLLGIRDNRRGQWVLAFMLEGIGEMKQLRLSQAFGAIGALQLSHLRVALRHCACLVHNDGVYRASLLKRLRAFNQDAVRCPTPAAHHDGSRRRQPKRTWARDNQHRDGKGQSL